MDCLIVEDVKITCDELYSRIRGSKLFNSVYCCYSGTEAWQMIEKFSPGFVLLDVELPDTSGLRIAKNLVRREHKPIVLMMTGFLDERIVCGLHQLTGIAGIILKTDHLISEFPSIIGSVLQRKYYTSPSYLDVLIGYLSSNRPLYKLLNFQQRELLELVGVGLNDREIAQSFSITEEAVLWRIKKLREILQVHTRCELMTIALNSGFAKDSRRKMNLIGNFGI